MNTGQLASRSLRYISEGDVANSRTISSGLVAMLTDLVQVAELSVAQNMETASRRDKARNAS